ncbi:MAG: ARMT1-like domain-containing protein [Candidatus Hydrogenedentota bacterium]
MKTFFDCIPCFVRQALDAIRRATDDETVHEDVLREALRAISEMDLRGSPPAMGYTIHRLVRDRVGEGDPYREMKDESNRYALELYPDLQEQVQNSSNPLETAVRLAIAGNIIDVAVKSDMDHRNVKHAIHRALSAPFEADLEGFAKAVAEAERILYLADNAGEIVLDRLLLERLPLERVTLVVRGAPVINDATMVDAQAAGLTELVEVMDNGADVPGTILELSSELFRQRFDAADLVIAKGQGNYETLSEVPKDIFFILLAKCPVIARDIGCNVGELVLRRSNHVGVSQSEDDTPNLTAAR